MGNCSFKGVVPADELHCSTRSSGIIRVVSDSGRIFQFYEPVLVQKFLVDFPGFGVFRQVGRPSCPLSGGESLVGGKIYRLLPLEKNKNQNFEVEETEQGKNTEEEEEEKEKRNQIVKTQICGSKIKPMIEVPESRDESEAEISTKKKKKSRATKTEQELEEGSEMATKKKENQIIKTQIRVTKTDPILDFPEKKGGKSKLQSQSFCATKTEQELEEGSEMAMKEKENQIFKNQIRITKTDPNLDFPEKIGAQSKAKSRSFCATKTEQELEEGSEMATKEKEENQIIKTQIRITKTDPILDFHNQNGAESKAKSRSFCASKTEQELGERTIEPARMSSVEQLTNGSAMEVLPSKSNGVWRVKLVIDTKQLEEIFSEQVNTEALIEKMRSAASSSSETVTPRTRSGWGVSWRPRVYGHRK